MLLVDYDGITRHADVSLDACCPEPTWRARGLRWSEVLTRWPPTIHCTRAGARGPQSGTTEGRRRRGGLVRRGAGGVQDFPPRPTGSCYFHLASVLRPSSYASTIHIENVSRLRVSFFDVCLCDVYFFVSRPRCLETNRPDTQHLPQTIYRPHVLVPPPRAYRVTPPTPSSC